MLSVKGTVDSRDKLANHLHKPASNPNEAIIVGCVAYADSIASIWEGMRQYFITVGVAFDFVMFTTYDRQVEALVNGSIDIAWNGPLAHVRVQKRTGGQSVSLGMRDVDRGFSTNLVVRADAGIKDVAGLAGKKLAVGTYDSPQACVLPLQALAAVDGGALLKQIHVTRFDRDLGKHGDTAAGELEVIRALVEGEVDAGFVSGVMFDRAVGAGDVNAGSRNRLEVVPGACRPFDHCQFDAMPTLSEEKRLAFSTALFAMDWGDADQRRVMQQEGIRAKWETPREEGYAAMRDALANEEAVPFPPPHDTPEQHRFASLEVRTKAGFPATEFVRSCAAVPANKA